MKNNHNFKYDKVKWKLYETWLNKKAQKSNNYDKTKAQNVKRQTTSNDKGKIKIKRGNRNKKNNNLSWIKNADMAIIGICET